MRIGLGALLFEGNTFSPVVSALESFRSKYLFCGNDIISGLRGTNTEAAGAVEAAITRGVEVVPLLATHGGAGGRVSAATYQNLKDEMIERLKAGGTLDGLYVALHGAFVAEGIDDVEGDLLSAMRVVVGDIPLVVSCDMHAHITQSMLMLSDAVIGYQLYPHDDTADTGTRSMRLLVDMIEGLFKPVVRAYRVPMLAPAQKQRTSGNTPMARIFDLARSAERDGVRVASYFCVQPWMDFPSMGFTSVVVAEDAGRADAVALDIARMAWDLREEFLVEMRDPATAIAEGLRSAGQVILADAADCVGGGATGRSAEVLKALVEAAPNSAAAIHLVAPNVVAAASNHRAGERFDATFADAQGRPFSLPVEVVSVAPGNFTYKGGFLGGVTASMGLSAVLHCGQVDILAASLSAYEYGDEAFLSVGIDPATKKFVVVKNPMNYQAGYPDATAYYVLATDGPTTPDLGSLPWRRMDRPTFPLDRDFTPSFAPLATGSRL